LVVGWSTANRPLAIGGCSSAQHLKDFASDEALEASAKKI